jgi:hypothetical protein
MNSRRFTLKALTAAVALSTLSALPALAADTIKVGILHSLSGILRDVSLQAELGRGVVADMEAHGVRQMVAI